MKKFVLSLTCLLLCSTFGFAVDVDVPDQKITGLEKIVPLGDVVKLELPPVPPNTKNFSQRSLAWSVWDGEKQKTFIPSGDGILMGTGIVNKNYKIILSVSYLYLIKNDAGVITGVEVRQRLIIDTLKVGADTPTPPPLPPAPVPVVFPDGKYKASAFIYKTASTLVPEDGRAAMAASLASSYAGISSAIAAGTVKDGKAALELVTASNRAALGVNAAAWDSTFVALQDYSYNFYQQKQLINVADFKIFFDELSIGLRAVK